MLRPTDKTLESLYYLRDVVFPFMEELKEVTFSQAVTSSFKGDRLYLDGYLVMHECGTLGCVAGWYAQLRYHSQDAGHISTQDFSQDVHLTPLFSAFRFQGFSTQKQDLQDRRQVLEGLIEKHELALASR